MADTYKGDSPGKKLIRFRFWVRVMGLLGEERFRGGRYMVLAGRDGADVRCLRALGVPEKSVLAIDRRPSVAADVADRFECEVECGELLDVATRASRRQAFDALLLDFCSPISPRLVGQVARVASFCLRDRGILGTGFMYGREASRPVRSALPQAKALLRDWIADGGHAEMRARCPHMGLPETLPVPGPGVAEAAEAVGARAFLYSAILQEKTSAFPLVTHAVWSGTYNSVTSSGRGVPMVYFASRVNRLRGRVSARHRATKIARHALLSDRAGESHFDMAPRELGLSESELRDTAIKAARFRGSEVAADLLNLSPRTVAAWLAHDTMGTYKESA